MAKIFTGTVVSKKMIGTATVAVARVIIHPVYKKRVRRLKKYQVHDEFNSEVGQVVKFAASKPYSKTVKWNLLELAQDKKAAKKVKNTEVNKELESSEKTSDKRLKTKK